jgi:transposase InsO family protein
MSTREVEEATAQDNELTEVKHAIQSGRFEKCKSYMPFAGELCISGRLVLRGTRIVLPHKLRPQALALAHEGHLRSKVYWPGMDKAAEKHCKSCHGCQLVAQPDPPEPIKSTSLPDAPWQHLAADQMGPFPSGHSILVVVDYYSRFYEYHILRSTTTDKVIDAMEEMFSRHGLPLTIKTDNGPQFKAAEFDAYCTANGITHVKVTPKWAQANGEVERQNRSMEKRIKIARAEGLDWKNELRRYVTKYRGLPQTTTGKSPAELMFNRQIKGKLTSTLAIVETIWKHETEMQSKKAK